MKALELTRKCLSDQLAFVEPGQEEVDLATELARFTAVYCGSWADSRIGEFTRVVISDLAEMPYPAMMEALRKARQTVRRPEELLRHIAEQVEAETGELRGELRAINIALDVKVISA